MPNKLDYLSEVKEGLNDLTSLTSQIEKALERAEKQGHVRADAIRIINAMCDALQLACDLVSSELTAKVVEFNGIVHSQDKAKFTSFFGDTARRFGDVSVGQLLHEGKVCGELHALGDGFAQPFSQQTQSGVSFTQALVTLFRRSNPMSQALEKLHGGEREYLRSVETFLFDIVTDAMSASGDLEALRESGQKLVGKMRDKHRTIHEQMWSLRDSADACVKTLH